MMMMMIIIIIIIVVLIILQTMVTQFLVVADISTIHSQSRHCVLESTTIGRMHDGMLSLFLVHCSSIVVEVNWSTLEQHGSCSA